MAAPPHTQRCTDDRNPFRTPSRPVDPLASIFGSGFLVIVPILNAAVGPYAVFAMAGVCALAYAMGSVIRFNIRNVEPALEAGTIAGARRAPRAHANLALVLAYAISVSLYIHILSAFLLGGLGINTPRRENLLSVLIIAAIGLLGRFHGLDMLLGSNAGPCGSPAC